MTQLNESRGIGGTTGQRQYFTFVVLGLLSWDFSFRQKRSSPYLLQKVRDTLPQPRVAHEDAQETILLLVVAIVLHLSHILDVEDLQEQRTNTSHKPQE